MVSSTPKPAVAITAARRPAPESQRRPCGDPNATLRQPETRDVAGCARRRTNVVLHAAVPAAPDAVACGAAKRHRSICLPEPVRDMPDVRSPVRVGHVTGLVVMAESAVGGASASRRLSLDRADRPCRGAPLRRRGCRAAASMHVKVDI